MWPQKNPKSPKSLGWGREDSMNVYSRKMRCTKHLPITYPKLEYLFPLLYAYKVAGRDKLFHSETTDKCFPDLRLPVAYGINSLHLRCKHSIDIFFPRVSTWNSGPCWKTGWLHLTWEGVLNLCSLTPSPGPPHPQGILLCESLKGQ